MTASLNVIAIVNANVCKNHKECKNLRIVALLWVAAEIKKSDRFYQLARIIL